MRVILAIDGGGSRTRCLAIDEHGRVVGQSETGPSNHLLVAADVVERSLAEAIHRALNASGLTRDDVACLSAGMAGVDFDGAGADDIADVFRRLGFDQPLINGDMVVAHAGALGLSAGVIVVAGTGSVILGVGENGERVKVGGWGPVYGDEGSAYRIGEMSLRAAARAYDGTGPATALTEALVQAMGLMQFPETVMRVYVRGMEPREIATLAKVAYEIAEAGDEVAREIFMVAADELVDGVEAAIRKIDSFEQRVIVSYQGSVLESCHLLRMRLIEQLHRKVPNAEVVVPQFEPVIGAYLLGRKELGWKVDRGIFEELKRK